MTTRDAAPAPIDLSQVDRLGTILSIWAHPDDETFVAGGIMAAAVDQGQRVVCVSATVGEHGTDDPAAWPPDRLGRVRRWECAAAMAVLGVTDHRFLDLPDGGLVGLDPTGPVERLARIIDEVRPDSILTFGPDGGTFHPDHQTVSAWVGAAWRRVGTPGRLFHAASSEERMATWGAEYERWGVYMSDERPVPVAADRLAVHVRLAGEALDRKTAALCAMYTQMAPSIAAIGMETFRLINLEEAYVEAG